MFMQWVTNALRFITRVYGKSIEYVISRPVSNYPHQNLALFLLYPIPNANPPNTVQFRFQQAVFLTLLLGESSATYWRTFPYGICYILSRVVNYTRRWGGSENWEDAGMPMPMASPSMLMPGYQEYSVLYSVHPSFLLLFVLITRETMPLYPLLQPTWSLISVTGEKFQKDDITVLAFALIYSAPTPNHKFQYWL